MIVNLTLTEDELKHAVAIYVNQRGYAIDASQVSLHVGSIVTATVFLLNIKEANKEKEENGDLKT